MVKVGVINSQEVFEDLIKKKEVDLELLLTPLYLKDDIDRVDFIVHKNNELLQDLPLVLWGSPIISTLGDTPCFKPRELPLPSDYELGTKERWKSLEKLIITDQGEGKATIIVQSNGLKYGIGFLLKTNWENPLLCVDKKVKNGLGEFKKGLKEYVGKDVEVRQPLVGRLFGNETKESHYLIYNIDFPIIFRPNAKKDLNLKTLYFPLPHREEDFSVFKENFRNIFEILERTINYLYQYRNVGKDPIFVYFSQEPAVEGRVYPTALDEDARFIELREVTDVVRTIENSEGYKSLRGKYYASEKAEKIERLVKDSIVIKDPNGKLAERIISLFTEFKNKYDNLTFLFEKVNDSINEKYFKKIQDVLKIGEWKTSEEFIELIGLSNKIPDYTLTKCVGGGGYSKVYLAKYKHLDRIGVDEEFILKIPAEIGEAALLTSHNKFVAMRFGDGKEAAKNEIRILHSLKHPNIIQPKGAELIPVGKEEEGKYAILLEYIKDARNLRAKYKDIKFNDDNPYPILIDDFLRIVDATYYIHKKGLVHNDIAGENILVNEKDLKLIDFGLARPIQESDPLCFGHRYVAAPTSITGAKRDLWSIGALLYLCSSGQEPFKRKKGEPNKYEYHDLDYSSIPDYLIIPELFRPLIKKCFEIDESKQYRNTIEFRNELEDLNSKIIRSF